MLETICIDIVVCTPFPWNSQINIVFLYIAACPLRTFGDGCTTVCHCRDNTGCDAATGLCAAVGCEEGWVGESCDELGSITEGRNFMFVFPHYNTLLELKK